MFPIQCSIPPVCFQLRRCLQHLAGIRVLLGTEVALIPTMQRPTPKTHQLTLESVLAFLISSYLVYKVRSTAEPSSRFRVAEPTNR